MASESPADAAVGATPARAGNYRWVVCGLLFAVTAINYVDRQTLAVLAPDLQRRFGWSETDYSGLVLWFQIAYAAGYFVFGKFVDKIGARIGYAIAFVIWTISHIATGLASTLNQFLVARFALGIGESGNFPAGIKAVTEWFPQRERAFAIGVFNAGANVGAIITPLVVPFVIITLAMDWRWAFILTGLVQSVWLIAWLAMYRRPREHKRVGAAELALIESDPPDPKVEVSWFRLLRYKETWAYAVGKFLIDPVWWMFLFWLPKFFDKTYGLSLKGFALPLVAIYLISDVGSVSGGWMSSAMMKRGLSANSARKITMLIWAILVLPIVFAESRADPWMAVLIIGLATAAHQAFSANLYTLPSDVFPRYAVASVVGIGGTAGAIGGILMAYFVGNVLQARLDSGSSYTPIFIAAAGAYLLALLFIHMLSPRLKPVTLD